MDAKHKVAIITGSTGGLGSSFANILASQGCDLLLLCKHQHLLDLQAKKLSKEFKIKVNTITCDLAYRENIAAALEKIGELQRIDYLVNCAGYSEHSLFSDENIGAVLQMIEVHVSSTVQFIHAVLPQMIKRKSGAIITVSSLAAFLPAPGGSIYAATKAFLNSFIESVHMEVHVTGVKMQCLCPGLTHTNFHSTKQNKVAIPCIDLWMEADEVVKHSLHDLENGNVICIPGFINRSIKSMLPVLPRTFYYKIAEKISNEKFHAG